jgi:hypothetical protein
VRTRSPTRRGSGARRSCHAEGGPKSGSLKTEEKTKTVDLDSWGGRTYDPRDQNDWPNSAPTGNWFVPDRTDADHRQNSAP